MHEITEKLYFGGIEAAADNAQYDRHDINHVIQLTYSDPDGGYPRDVAVHTFSMMDGPRNDEAEFREAVAKTVALLREGESVLVHCSAGESRSACVAAAALGRLDELSFEDALDCVRTAGSVTAHETLRAHGRVCCSE